MDALHIVGDGEQFYLLTEADKKALQQETDKVDKLMADYGKIVAGAKDAPACGRPSGQASREQCACLGCQQWRWSKQAMAAGLLTVRELADPATQQKLMSQDDIQGQISELKKRRADYDSLTARVYRTTGVGTGGNADKLKTRVIAQIDAEIAQLSARLGTVPRDSGSSAGSAMPDAKHALYSRSVSVSGSRSTQTVHGVVEIIVLGRPNRRYYLPVRYVARIQQYERVTTRVLRSNIDLKAMAGQLLDDIRKQISNDRAKPLGNLTVKLKEWTAPEDCAINALHQEVKWTSNDQDSAPYAANAEGHLLRFAASASASLSGFDPKNGEVAIGVKGSASFALGEGKVGLTGYFPDQGGYDCTFPYRNADNKIVYLRFGAFRLEGGVELSCFVGAKVSGSAEASVKWKPTPSGGTALLAPPGVSSRPGAGVQVKGSAFAGAEAGGALTGSLKWLAPEDQHKKQANWSALVELKAEGSVAFGIGGEFDFTIRLSANKLEFHAKAQVVYGPGAAGGFGTTVDVGKIADLMAVIYKAGHAADYHPLVAVQKEAFEYFYRGAYQALSNPQQTLEQVMRQGADILRSWWKDRSSRIAEADALAKRIISGDPLQAGRQKIPLHQLPPEVLGPVLYTLSEYYVGLMDEDHENAIVKVLQLSTTTWRRFIKVLEHMSADASWVPAYESLQRLNLYLDGMQQDQFNGFIDKLAMSTATAPDAPLLAQYRPWQYVDGQQKWQTLMAARHVWLPEHANPNYPLA